MKISKKGEYALRALLFLTERASNRTCTPLHDIAEKDNLPVKFLEQIMMTLTRMGFVHSVKGKHGGYFLSRRPNDIKLGDIVRAIDGPLAPMLTAAEMQKRISRGDPHASLYSILLDVRNAVSNIMDKTTLADVHAKSLEMLTQEPNSLTYSI